MNQSGAAGEAYAAQLLEKKGFHILVRNFKTRFGEIDIIAQKGELLAFVEVKTRAADALSSPAAAVTLQKQRRLILAAEGYLVGHPTASQPRFDVVEVVTEPGGGFRVRSVNHLEDAFSLTDQNCR